MKCDIAKITELAKDIRRDILKMTYLAGANGGHLGGALSCADILAVLYGGVMNIDPENIGNVERDRFILSKGHVSIAHYAVLAECGFIEKEDLDFFEVSGERYGTHEDIDEKKGIEISSGSLGYGISVGVGSALAAKLDNRKNKVFVLVGDGECNEGTVWEAFMSAVQYGLDNLVVIIDCNKQQLDGYTKDIMQINNLQTVIAGMGCNCVEIDGHNYDDLINAINSQTAGKPTVIIADTIKGQGIPSIEGISTNHHMRISEEQYLEYMKELEG